MSKHEKRLVYKGHAYHYRTEWRSEDGDDYETVWSRHGEDVTDERRIRHLNNALHDEEAREERRQQRIIEKAQRKIKRENKRRKAAENKAAFDKEEAERIAIEKRQKLELDRERKELKLDEGKKPAKRRSKTDAIARDKYGVKLFSVGDVYSFQICVNNSKNFNGCRSVTLHVKGQRLTYTLRPPEMMALAKEVTLRFTPAEWQELMAMKRPT